MVGLTATAGIWYNGAQMKRLPIFSAVAFALSALAMILFTGGCSQSSPTRLDHVKSELSGLPASVMQARHPDASFYANLQRDVSGLKPQERELAFRRLRQLLETLHLNDSTLSVRQCSLEVYLDIVRKCASLFAESLDDEESVWEFLLLAYDIFDCEKEVVGASSYDPHIPAEGLHIDKSLYLSVLDQLRTRAFHDGFEQGAFCRFFWNLPADKQREWLSWLDFAAKRRLDPPNPDNPHRKAADSFFRIPPQVPRCVVEKRQRLRGDHDKLHSRHDIPLNPGYDDNILIDGTK